MSISKLNFLKGHLFAKSGALLVLVLILLIKAATATAAISEPSFEKVFNYDLEESPIGIVPGDFDGDGIIDLAVTYYISPGLVSVFLGNGNGTFKKAGECAVGSRPRCIAAADFTGDGILDLAVANSGSNDISILKGQGDGTFEVAESYAVDTNPYWLLAADFDNDGHIDLAVANYGSHNITILKNDGQGYFEPAENYEVNKNPHCLAVISRNGRIDLAVAQYSSTDENIYILQNDGRGTFEVPQKYSVGSSPNRNITAADFDNDGNIDLAITNYPLRNNPGNVYILQGNEDGTFEKLEDYPVGICPQHIVAADFNGDDIIDLAVANFRSSSISILLGKGDGSFRQEIEYPLQVEPKNIAAADFNNDGKIDLAIAHSSHNGLSILLNTTIAPSRLQFSQKAYQVSADASTAPITVSRIGSNNNNSVVSVVYSTTAAGTAEPDTDYLPVSGILTFNKGETIKRFNVPLLGNKQAQTGKTIHLSLSEPSEGAVLGNPSTAVLIITAPETEDKTPLQITANNPPEKAVDIDINKKIVLTFNKEIQPGDNIDAIRFYTDKIQIAYSHNISGNTLTIEPLAVLEYDCNYKLLIPAGAIKDLAGNDLKTAFQLQFSTRTAPASESNCPSPSKDKSSTSAAAANISPTQQMITVIQIRAIMAGLYYGCHNACLGSDNNIFLDPDKNNLPASWLSEYPAATIFSSYFMPLPWLGLLAKPSSLPI